LELGRLHEFRTRQTQKNDVKSFNSGTFLFQPCPEIKEHFANAKEFAKSYKSDGHFYDQSFFNYYFNTRGLSKTENITRQVKMFPDLSTYYPRKTILHVAGLRRYKEKARLMKEYLDFIISQKTSR
jgi:hypothetical protein